MLRDILVSVAISGGVILFLWFLRGMLLMPVKLGKQTQMEVILRVQGKEPQLEQTVKGLGWLRKNGTLPTDLILLDCGMDEHTRIIAEKLAVTEPGVLYRRRETELWQMNTQEKNYTDESIL